MGKLDHDSVTPKVMLEVTDLKKYFGIKAGILRRTVGHVRAVDGVSFSLREGETLASWASPGAASPRPGS